LSQLTVMTTSPWRPAAWPAIVLRTSSEPNASNVACARTLVWSSADCARISLCASLTPATLPE
jgi:hypothetical protein